MLALLRRQLLKLDSIKRLVTDYRWRQEKERNRERFAHLVHVSNTVHTKDKPMLIDYTDTRMLGQRCVTPLFYDPSWWRKGEVGNSEDIDPGDCNDFGNVARTGAGADSAGAGPSNCD